MPAFCMGDGIGWNPSRFTSSSDACYTLRKKTATMGQVLSYLQLSGRLEGAPGFRLAQPQLRQPFGKPTKGWQICHSNKYFCEGKKKSLKPKCKLYDIFICFYLLYMHVSNVTGKFYPVRLSGSLVISCERVLLFFLERISNF